MLKKAFFILLAFIGIGYLWSSAFGANLTVETTTPQTRLVKFVVTFVIILITVAVATAKGEEHD